MIAQDTGSAIVGGGARRHFFRRRRGRGRARRRHSPSRRASPRCCPWETSHEGRRRTSRARPACAASPTRRSRSGPKSPRASRERRGASLPTLAAPSRARAAPRRRRRPPARRRPRPDRARPPGPPPLAPLERRLKRDLARGRGAVDDALDLHGLNQAEAHHALRGFLVHAQARGAKLVIVVTGKGGARAPRRPVVDRRTRRLAPPRAALAARERTCARSCSASRRRAAPMAARARSMSGCGGGSGGDGGVRSASSLRLVARPLVALVRLHRYPRNWALTRRTPRFDLAARRCEESARKIRGRAP